MRHLLLFLLVACACTGNHCAAAEKNLLRLECKGEDGRLLGQGNRSGETYEHICLRVERVGKVDMRSECVAKAATCKEVEQCDR